MKAIVALFLMVAAFFLFVYAFIAAPDWFRFFFGGWGIYTLATEIMETD